MRVVQRHLPPVDPCHSVADPAQESGQRRRAADMAEQQVGATVVALDHDRGAQVAHRHAALGDMRFGDRRMAEQIGTSVVETRRKVVLPLVGTTQDEGREQPLERAAQ